MKKGFTLIELLGVIVLLITVFTITTMIIVSFVKDSNDAIDDATKKLLYTATENYLYDEIDLENNGTYTVTIKNLIEANKVSKTLLDTTEVEESSCIKVNIINGVFNYEYSHSCNWFW